MPQAQGAVRTVARRALAGLVGASLSPGLGSVALAEPGAVSFRAVAPGIEHAQLVAEGSAVYAFRIDLARARLRLVSAGSPGERRTVARLAEPFTQAVAVNASFFTEQDRAIGAVVDEGRAVAPRAVGSWGALIIQGGRSRISLGSELQLASDHPTLVVQGTPRLVVKGELMKLKRQTADRTAVCAMGPHVLLVVTEALEATALALLLRDRLGCQDALNLDGGPSTQLSARVGSLRLERPGGWGVPNALIALPGPPPPTSSP